MKHRMARQIIPKIILAALLAGCGSLPSAPQLVEVPVFTPCLKVLPQRPVYEFDRLTPAATDGEIVLAMARDWPRGRKSEGELEAIVAGCTQSVADVDH
ncbi:hypothetical protein CNX70_21815 [Janthinobacterium svalbardensis]|uniref:Uncharacterized protein n=1 Tax=Janthinobacterium svalbardensis TaxID=368607 RepID=A0A290X030_9BURK|nr:hypothetical protein [Janthinobacterium svalbardensis]ATD62487.1 hypothetical protein CNX70_21815 [Janthinobacterium svalbardensis]